MYLSLGVICVAAIALPVIIWTKRDNERKAMEQHSITPEALYGLLATDKDTLVFDVRQPLDLLASSEIIPGSKRIPPRDVMDNPSLLPDDKDSVVYCTCPSDKTSRLVLRRALAANKLRVKFLTGGLAAWKSRGYPVEPYLESFHLDVAR